MPRKAATSSVSASSQPDAPRRSTRISSLPKAEIETDVPVKKTRTKATGKTGSKRSAEGGPEEDSEDKTSSSKKAKADDDSAPAAEKPEEPEEEGEESVEKTPQLGHIDIGDILPSLTLKNEKDEDVDVATLTAEKGVVVFLVPKADTPGCTNQACGFRDIYPDFTSSGFDVYCLSADAPAAQSKWQAKKELPYPLLSDGKRVLIGALGAADGNKTKRSHFIFGKGGKLLDKKVPVKPVDSPRLALEFIKSLEQN